MEGNNNTDGQVNQQERKKGSWKEFFQLGEVGNYFFRGKDPNRPSNINIKMMHGVNKLSMLIFLVCVLVIVGRIIARNFF
jgi:hypothetical protein